jgi:pimeloyl-ACP methyl ester carboxylesterase
MDQRLEAAQKALLAQLAPDTRVRRLRWSLGETQVLELGSGPPLLLVHGGLGDAFAWVPIMPALAQKHRVLAVDLPGHGLSDPFDYSGVHLLDHARRFIGDILDGLQLNEADMVGSSLGGLCSIAFAIDASERVPRLVVIGMPGGYKRAVPVPLRVLGLPLIGQPLGRLVMSRPTRDGNRKFWGQVLVAHPENLDNRLLDADVASQRRNIRSHLSFLHCVLDAGGLRRRLILGERWRTLETPTVLLWGDRDAYGAPDEGEILARQAANLQLIRLPDAGHLAWLDQPELVVEELERFLAT